MALTEFGMFYEIEVPRPWTEHKEYEIFKQVIDQGILADELGYDYVWTVEHHFLAEFSHSSGPESLLPYLAAKTQNIRIGHGVKLMPFPYNHPVRSAEAAATLDLLCDGRLEFGTGRSVTWDELGGFGIDPEQTRAMWEEAVRVVVGCWTEDPFSHEGKYFNLPPRHVVPKPFQKPHPRLWMAGTGPDSHELAGRCGLGMLSFTLMVPPPQLKKRIDRYRNGLAQAKPLGKFVNDRAATFCLVHVAETDKEARETAAEACVWYTLESLKGVGTVPTKTNAYNPRSPEQEQEFQAPDTYDYLNKLLDQDVSKIDFDFLDSNDLVIVGDPDTCAEKVARYAEAGIDVFLPMMQIYDIPHDKVMQSMRLFAEHIMPRYQPARPDIEVQV